MTTTRDVHQETVTLLSDAVTEITKRAVEPTLEPFGAELRNTGEGERIEDFDIRQKSWTGGALPEVKVVRREVAGVPKVEVVGLSKEKVEELFWETIAQVSQIWRECDGIDFRTISTEWKIMAVATRHCRPSCAMVHPWT